ncbi:MAG: RHS domain-containing protein, partial [Verrucomicrobiota bacterium]
ALAGVAPSEAEALWVLDGEDVELLPLLQAAYVPRREYFGRTDDASRRVTRTVDFGGFSKTVVIERNADRRVTAWRGPDGNEIEFDYDARERLRSMTLPGEGAVTFDRYTINALNEVSLPGGSRMSYEFSPFAIAGQTVRDPANNLLVEERYTTDRENRITGISNRTELASFNYDPVGYLTSMQSSLHPDQTYAYDATGNRLSGPVGGENYQFNELNQMTNSAAGSYRYDDKGYLLERVLGGVTNRFRWDAAGRLVAVLDGAGSTNVTYAYDADNRRIMKDVGGVRTFFLHGRYGLAGEYDGAGNEIRSYAYRPTGSIGASPVYLKQGTNYFYYLNDHLGAPKKLIGKNGAVVWSASIDPFGAATVDPASSVVNPLRISSQYHDDETGLH